MKSVSRELNWASAAPLILVTETWFTRLLFILYDFSPKKIQRIL